MKILVLNPHFDAWRNILQSLQSRGDAVLFPENSTEAWQLLQLHGPSMDLAIIHREFGNQADLGTKFIERLKADPSLVDLPLLVTSEQWSDNDFAQHQQTAQGANAYLRWPFGQDVLFTTINAIFGMEAIPAHGDTSIPTLETIPGIESTISFEDADAIFKKGENSGLLSIFLEAPSSVMDKSTPEMPQVSEIPSQESSPVEKLGAENEAVIELSQIIVESPAQPQAEMAVTVEAPVSEIPEVHETTVEDDAGALKEMPYLFGKPAEPSKEAFDPNLMFAHPVGDAIVPGGAGESPDIETLKKYLHLREKDVTVLSSQLRSAKQQVVMLENLMQEERNKNADLTHSVDDLKKKLDEAQKANSSEAERLKEEILELRFLMKAKADKAKILEGQVLNAADEMDNLRERVRVDIRKIRIREKDLENKLEIIRKDSEVLIGARESKIIELKRKLDLLEFNMDLLQDRYNREKESNAQLRERLNKAAQVVRVAGGFLDNPAAQKTEDDETLKTEREAS